MIDILGYIIEQLGWTTSITIPVGYQAWVMPDLLALSWWAVSAVGLWPMQRKAGRSPVAAVIPIVNLYATLKLASMRGWWVLAYFVPVLSIIMAILIARGLGRNFAKSSRFTLFLIFALQPIGFLILGFGRSRFDPDTPVLAARNIYATELA